jgi:protein phosphatase
VLRLRAPVKIFGDLHGQLGDLHRLFAAFGAPSADGDIFATDYLFAGDFVDRGHHQLEVMCLLLALKVAHPGGVHLLRGNHEIESINKSEGFQKHCVLRLGMAPGKRVCARINALFEWLPLAALIETPPSASSGAPAPTRVLVLHGA